MKEQPNYPNEYEYNCIECGKKCKIIHFGVVPDKCTDCNPPLFSISEREMFQRFIDDTNAKK